MLTIRALDELVTAVDRIHDRWFDVEAITYDASARAVRIPFWRQPTTRPPIDRVNGEPEPFDDLLVVHDSDEPRIEDREQIGNYLFNDVVVRGLQLDIRAEPYFQIACTVRQLYITVGDDQP